MIQTLKRIILSLGKSSMNKLFTALLILLLSMLTGCNGSSGKNDVDESPSVATNLTLSTLNAQGLAQLSFDKNETVFVQATVFEQNNNVMSGVRVNFSTDLGELALDSKLTDVSGIALVELTNTQLTLSAGTLSISSASLSANADFEFINNSPEELLPTLAMHIELNGQITNQFKANEQVQISVTLLDNLHQPVANQIINFSADIGQLNTNTALTQTNGKALVTLSGNDSIGAGVITATMADNESVTMRVNYQVVAADAIIDDDIRLGYFDDNNNFIEGEISTSLSDNNISAGGTIGLSIELIDNENNRVITPTPVTFSSNCVLNDNATIDESVFSINGRATATFEDVDCAGVSGTEDIIVASVTSNGITNTASTTIDISGEQLGSIEFVSAQPSSIVLKGTGGQETATLAFLVKSELGNVLAQQLVGFELDTSAGGITLSRDSGYTNSQGLITTQVSSGTVPTVVRVTASASMTVNGEEVNVQTQSNELSVNTGLPEQRSLTIAASVLNPEADLNGVTSTITAWLADNFNNPVPDGTSVNFTTEGGVIEPSCTTTNGNCSVTWTSSEPRISNHRSTILATALGHESFFDTNGNNIFDNDDGNAIVDASVSSGFGRHYPEASGFIDMSEAWRDDNENNVFDNGETFLDYDNNGSFDNEDSLFNGPQCQGSKCASSPKNAIHVRKALVLVMSGSNANYELSDADSSVIYQDSFGNNNAIPDIADGASMTFDLKFSDLATQTLPMGSTITVEASAGELAGQTSYTVSNNNGSGYTNIVFVLANPIADDQVEATLTIAITSPSGVTTSIVKTVTLL